MADPSIVREWLSKADEDFNFAKINLDEDNKFYSQIYFHFQQAAEKYLKAYIAAYDLEFEKDDRFLPVVCSRGEPAELIVMASKITT